MAASFLDGLITIVVERTFLPNESIDWLVDRLTRSGVVCPVSADQSDLSGPDAGFVPARPAAKIPILRVLEMDGLPESPRANGRYAPEIANKVARVQQQAVSSLGHLTPADLIDAE